jgi:3-isopropylmalate dehydrogenase
MAMILSAAMMLEWLADKGGNDMIVAARTMREAVFDVLREGRSLTPDLGGASSTQDVCAAVRARCLAGRAA